ncbi:hypothetical protein AQS8620_01399 [Aquimixticola soesokkakensis]|uniref:Glycosyl transferase family 2 n=1 Tax=Aquimixticola soesokkakensis TaxID=1519096 RepID=A0A1Y5SCR6_9RHOB|nr:hypothetical protein [Aquimixticola soesokkakensis]SLN37754.1 hypothetical protein AQS8620_01399 [Aquimixticola soesokkakensis]
MRAPVSVVITGVANAAGFTAQVKDLMAGIDAGLIREVLVCDLAHDGLADLIDAVGAEIVEGGVTAARAACGAAWRLELAQGARLPEGWVGRVEALVLSGAQGARRSAFRLPVGLRARIWGRFGLMPVARLLRA